MCVLRVHDGRERLALVQLGDAAHPLLHLLRVALQVLHQLRALPMGRVMHVRVFIVEEHE